MSFIFLQKRFHSLCNLLIRNVNLVCINFYYNKHTQKSIMKKQESVTASNMVSQSLLQLRQQSRKEIFQKRRQANNSTINHTPLLQRDYQVQQLDNILNRLDLAQLNDYLSKDKQIIKPQSLQTMVQFIRDNKHQIKATYVLVRFAIQWKPDSSLINQDVLNIFIDLLDHQQAILKDSALLGIINLIRKHSAYRDRLIQIAIIPKIINILHTNLQTDQSIRNRCFLVLSGMCWRHPAPPSQSVQAAVQTLLLFLNLINKQYILSEVMTAIQIHVNRKRLKLIQNIKTLSHLSEKLQLHKHWLFNSVTDIMRQITYSGVQTVGPLLQTFKLNALIPYLHDQDPRIRQKCLQLLQKIYQKSKLPKIEIIHNQEIYSVFDKVEVREMLGLLQFLSDLWREAKTQESQELYAFYQRIDVVAKWCQFLLLPNRNHPSNLTAMTNLKNLLFFQFRCTSRSGERVLAKRCRDLFMNFLHYSATINFIKNGGHGEQRMNLITKIVNCFPQ